MAGKTGFFLVGLVFFLEFQDRHHLSPSIAGRGRVGLWRRVEGHLDLLPSRVTGSVG